MPISKTGLYITFTIVLWKPKMYNLKQLSGKSLIIPSEHLFIKVKAYMTVSMKTYSLQREITSLKFYPIILFKWKRTKKVFYIVLG